VSREFSSNVSQSWRLGVRMGEVAGLDACFICKNCVPHVLGMGLCSVKASRTRYVYC
jgi:hypothetical protein